MSMDQLNEYEQAIEDYANAVRREDEAEKAFKVALNERENAVVARQESWRRVAAYRKDGKIKVGIYRLHKGPSVSADALLITENGDYPDLFPMFR